MKQCPICGNQFIDTVNTCFKCQVGLVPLSSVDTTTQNTTGNLTSNNQPRVHPDYVAKPQYNTGQLANTGQLNGTQQPLYNTGQLYGNMPNTGYMPYPPVPMNQPTSGAAVASLVFGLLSLCGFFFVGAIVFAILAIILGGVGLSGNKGGRGMAIAGLILGLVALFPTLAVTACGLALF